MKRSIILQNGKNGKGTSFHVPAEGFNRIKIISYKIEKEPDANIHVGIQFDGKFKESRAVFAISPWTISFSEFKKRYLEQKLVIPLTRRTLGFHLSLGMMDGDNFIKLSDGKHFNFSSNGHSDNRLRYSAVKDFKVRLQYQLLNPRVLDISH